MSPTKREASQPARMGSILLADICGLILRIKRGLELDEPLVDQRSASKWKSKECERTIKMKMKTGKYDFE